MRVLFPQLAKFYETRYFAEDADTFVVAAP